MNYSTPLPPFTIYDKAHKQFFVSNPDMNEIDVFDATHETETAQISVPTAWGLDITPDNSTLYAGTLLGDVYQIDTATLTVTKRYPSASIGPSGYLATIALVLFDGRLALQGVFNGGVDPAGPIAIWNPVTNALDLGPNGSSSSTGLVGTAGICASANGGAFALSGDRTHILSKSDLAVTGSVCSYDVAARIETYGVRSEETGASSFPPQMDNVFS